MLIFGHSAVTEYLLDLAQCQPRRNGLALVARKKGPKDPYFELQVAPVPGAGKKKGFWSLGNGVFFARQET